MAALSNHPSIVKDLKKSKIDISDPEIAASVDEDHCFIPCTDERIILLAAGWKDTKASRRTIREHGPWCLYVFWGIFEDDIDTIQLVRLRPTKPIVWKYTPENRKRISAGKKPKSQKYLSHKGGMNYPFYPKSAPRVPQRTFGRLPRQQKDDDVLSCIWTEGEKKACSAWYHAGIPTLGAVGVWGHRRKDEWDQMKYREALKHGFDSVHPDDRGECASFMYQIDWKRMRPVIIYDSDLATNDKVKDALVDLTQRMYQRGCEEVKYSFIPSNQLDPSNKIGIDDLLLQPGGEDHLLDLFRSAVSTRNKEVYCPASCQSRLEWLLSLATHGGRFGACNDCRRGGSDYACAKCGINIGVGRPYSTSDHCPKSGRRLLVKKDNHREGAVMCTCCHGWDCVACGYRHEFDHRCHYQFWGSDLHQGIIHIPCSRHPSDLRSTDFRVGAIYHFPGIPFQEYQSGHKNGQPLWNNTKANFSGFLSKLKKKYGGLHVSLFSDAFDDTFDYYLFIEEGVEVNPSDLQWHCQRGPSQGTVIQATAITTQQFEQQFFALLSQYGQEISLDRLPSSKGGKRKKPKRQCPISYCELLGMAKRSISSGKYRLFGNAKDSLKVLIKKIKDRQGLVQDIDASKIDLSHLRGLNRVVWGFTKFQLPLSMSDGEAEAFFHELTQTRILEPAPSLSPSSHVASTSLEKRSKRLHIQHCLFST
ncbi:MAG: DUF3854 domain-containing protein [Pirellulales bacterium]